MPETELDFDKLGNSVNQALRSLEFSWVITIPAHISEALADLLKTFFIDDAKVSADLLSGFGPLASFYARIETATALGLISDIERHDLDLIRKIRNDFAHSQDYEISFQTPHIRDRCLDLQIPSRLNDPSPTDGPRERFFKASVCLLLAVIERRDRVVRQQKREFIIEERVQEAVKSLSFPGATPKTSGDE